MSKLKEKLNLLPKLKELQDSLKEGHGSHTLANKYFNVLTNNGVLKSEISELEKYISEETSADVEKINTLKSLLEIKRYRLLEGENSIDLHRMMREFSVYNWLAPVEKFMKGVYEDFNSNQVLSVVENTIPFLKAKGSVSFDKAVKDLSSIYEKETFSAEELYLVLNEHLWIPEVKSIVVLAENVQNAPTQLSADAQLIKSYSPIVEHADGSFSFNLTGAWYNIKNGELTNENRKSDSIEDRYLDMISNFTISEGVFTTYHKKAKIVIKIDENKEGRDANKVYVNDVLVEGDVKTYLTASGLFRADEMSKIMLIEFAAFNAHNIVELDFVTSIISKKRPGIATNIIKVDESLYVNKVNESMLENKISKVESAKDVIIFVKEFINYDVTNCLLEELALEKEFESLVESSKVVFEDRINFLNEQLNELSKLDKELGNTTEIKEAKKILLDSITEQKSQLSDLYSKK